MTGVSSSDPMSDSSDWITFSPLASWGGGELRFALLPFGPFFPDFSPDPDLFEKLVRKTQFLVGGECVLTKTGQKTP